ncbi:hypothetical protein, variant 1 [Plasmopara halstedii]|uniref:VHS domain-containing protein n=1 Tax=Plasmopara halstedii TaxID=4781 RepID=A0A0P1AM73_PLAHL|nr:hypothetical protein, variant 1 [Plasmopara halstedii]CEG42300.1 hypothetical protein, variant 1 [Plasmopara halstedii]|eukprot:XP_024578669.1 hypothetical protein, variant 1 [Plasmopara halstedii]
MEALRKKMPSKRALTSTINQIVQQKAVAVLYTPTEVERIKQMTDMIAQATNEFEPDEDWNSILRVVDALSNVSNRAVLKESIRYLRLRLGDPSSRVVILALTLTESIVKNCGDLVHQEIATEQFMSEMEELHRTHSNKRGRQSMEIASRVLDMVQAWGEAFLPFRHDFPLFVDTYHNMRKKGIKFPDQYDESKVPVLTPSLEGTQSQVAGSQISSLNYSRGSSRIGTSSYSHSSSGLGGLSTPELYRVATNVLEMFDDMLFEAQKDSSSITNHGVMAELAVEVREIVHRLKGAITIAVAEEDTHLAQYLSINDDLHAALEKYDALLKENQESEEVQVVETKKIRDTDTDLIDPFGLKDDVYLNDNTDNQKAIEDDPFADFVHARSGSKKATTAISPDKAKSERKDEEDLLAFFVQQRSTKVSKSCSNQDAEKAKLSVTSSNDLINLWDDVPPTTLVSAPIDSSSKPDVWFGDDFFGNSIQQSMQLPTTQRESSAQGQWCGNNHSSALSVATGPLNTAKSASGSTIGDPSHNLLTKTSLSTPAENPFDNIPYTSSAQLTHTRGNTSCNPFDI